LYRKNRPDVLLVAAGGIADGRGLAASLMLGADGVLVGSRFWAASEALVNPDMWQAAIDAGGDDTQRSTIVDIVRNKDWPDRYTINLVENEFSKKWHGREAALKVDKVAHQTWQDALDAGNSDIANVFVGEATGLIHDIKPVAEIIGQMIEQAKGCLKGYG